MENNQNIYHISPAIAIAVILQLVFIIFAGITIYGIFNQDTIAPKIKISNYTAIPTGEIIGKDSSTTSQNINFAISDSDKSNIENAIYRIASINNEVSITNHGAKIREGSAHYVYIGSLDTYFLNFIIDIEDLGQSYRFTWRQPRDNSGQVMFVNTIMVFCPREDEIVYGNFNCKDEYDDHGLDITVFNLLRYKMFSNFTVGLSDVYNGEPLTISINVGSNSESAKASAIEEVSNYLTDLGFNLEDFKYSTNFIEIAN